MNNDILKQGQYKGNTSLKRIEDYRLKELIKEDLKIYTEASLREINQRIGKEVDSRRLQILLRSMVEGGILGKVGNRRWTKYRLL